MSRENVLFGLAALMIGLGAATSLHAQPYSYSMVWGGAQFEIGDDYLWPIPGFDTPPPPPTRTMFPPLMIGVNPFTALVKQTVGPDPRQLRIPQGLFKRIPSVPGVTGAFANNPKIFQVRTKNSFSLPGFASATLKAGGRTGPPTTTFLFYGPGPYPGNAKYTKTKNQFGGVAQAKVVAASPIRVHAVADGAMAPCKHPAFGGADTKCVATLIAPVPHSKVAVGGAVGFTVTTPGGPAPVPGLFAVSVPLATGLVAMSAATGMGSPGATNMATSFALPWTTGRLTLSHPSALGAPEAFILTGMDSRVGGLGTISLVSGALSVRTYTGANANRGWMRIAMPEPGAALGAAAALAALAVCHSLARRAKR